MSNTENITPESTPEEASITSSPETSEQPEGSSTVSDTPPEPSFENVDSAPDTEEEIAKILTDRGFDYEKLQAEYDQFGDITAETREQLAKKGITPTALNQVIEKRKAEVQAQMSGLIDSVGGQEQYDTVINWAKANLSDEEKKEIDEIHNPYALQVILRDLKQRMENVDGYLPSHITGNGGKPPVDVFESMVEVQEAISNPKYDKDEVYRDKVGKKITASVNAGYIKF